ncbi:MAG: FAD-dependent oxidoreductase [Actinomycetes bacterium]
MTRVVVVGEGMVGTRFVTDLLALDRDERFEVTVLGEEPYEPYNRILLAEVLAGAVDLAAITMPSVEGPRARVVRGQPAVAVDRQRRLVRTADGTTHAYDLLVLATGARARVPDVPGLGAELPGGVHALRTVDDCRDLVAGATNARRAVVLGGGLLGLEAARGLSQRGVPVTVVHAAPHLMERQLDADAAAVLAAAAERLGLQVLTGAQLAEVVRDGAGRLASVRLRDGAGVPADLLLLAVGAAPETALARAAGLPVDVGVLVGEDLRSPADGHVAAIGDCAQPPEGGTGLVADGWAQSRRLADLLTGRGTATAPQQRGPGVVVLKAEGLDVVTMGRPGTAGDRRVRLSDPVGLRHVEVVVDGDALAGATCVGAPDVAADLMAAFDRGTPLPVDPAHLLVRPATGVVPREASSPTTMPDRATVCRCNGVTKGDLVRAWSGGARTVEHAARATRATTGCGSCREAVCGLLEWLARADPDPSQPPPARGEEPVSPAKPSRRPAETRRS